MQPLSSVLKSKPSKKLDLLPTYAVLVSFLAYSTLKTEMTKTGKKLSLCLTD
jgi:hypothetical protein